MAYSTCIRCQTCDGFPCLVHAKCDAEVVAVRPALEHPNVTLLRNAKALRLETDAARHGGDAASSPTSTGERRGLPRRHRRRVMRRGQFGRTAAASANDKHPNGLANGSDQVGRNYMFHNSQAVLAISREPNRPCSRRP